MLTLNRSGAAKTMLHTAGGFWQALLRPADYEGQVG